MRYFSLAAIGLAVVVSGCATTTQPTKQTGLQQELQQLRSENAALERKLASARQRLESQPTQEQTDQALMFANGVSLIPQNAEPGQCFARVITPAEYEKVTKRVLVSTASKKIKTIPPEYGWTTKRILVKPATTKLVTVPATYKTVTKKIMVSPKHTKWVPGHGETERVNPITGQTMCLITVPAEYETVTKRVVATPAHTKKVTIPAEYKTIKVRKVVREAQTKTIKIPAEYRTLTTRKKVEGSEIQWSRVVCDRNATHELIRTVQTKLKKLGYTPGPIDGILGPRTMSAVRAYDRDHDLPYSNAQVITYTTLESLGISMPAP